MTRKCRRGHAIEGENRIMRTARGRTYASCRKCFNHYQQRAQRKVRLKRVLERAARLVPQSAGRLMERYYRYSRAFRKKGA